MKTEIIKIDSLASSKWSGGETTQIYITPSEMTSKDNFNYRISSATVLKGESVFSDFSAYNRFLVILNGEIKISHNDGEYKTIKSFEPYFFDGAAKTKSTANCDIVDFNVIHKKNIDNLMFDILKEENSFERDSPIFLYNHKDNAEISIEYNNDINKEIKKYSLKEKEIILIYDVKTKYKIKTKGKLIVGSLVK